MSRVAWVVVVVALGCGGHRVDTAENGRRDALNCVVERGGEAPRAAALCGRRSFAPGTPLYRAAYAETLECVAGQSGSGADAVQACGAAG